MTAVSTIDQEITVVDSQAIDEQDSIRVAESNCRHSTIFWIETEEREHPTRCR